MLRDSPLRVFAILYIAIRTQRKNRMSQARTRSAENPWHLHAKVNRTSRLVRNGIGEPYPLKADRTPFSFRKEVIQPQVLLRLPCYDFTPIMSHTLSACLLAVGTA